jgi:lysophospholipase L1-like esterase
MGYQFASISMGPVLAAQGLYVRHITPRLPEPMGDRSGIDGSGLPMRLLILGDSAAAGVGVSTQDAALSGQLVFKLASDFRVYWKLIAKTGYKANDALNQIEMMPREEFDVVVMSVGVNDVTHGTGARKWIYLQNKLIKTLESKFHAKHILISSLPPMHLFPSLPQPLRWYLGMRVKLFNDAIQNLIRDRDHCEFVSISFPPEQKYIAADGFHPGASAYTVWSNHLNTIIRQRMTKDDPK